MAEKKIIEVVGATGARIKQGQNIGGSIHFMQLVRTIGESTVASFLED